MERQYKNYAFISYKREDEKWAKWLQRKLESYKLPSVIRKESLNMPKYIRPVFRDKTDLSGGILTEQLYNELEHSKYLIVICSPNSAQSTWVSKEVRTFIEEGRIKYIIPFIVDGVPHSIDSKDECFPEDLRNIPNDQELLGINVQEIGREKAFIRLTAYMIGVSFDSLWQRYRRQEKRKRLSLAVCTLTLMGGCIFYWDYTRATYKYYADYVDCWGVPKGVVELTNEQVLHRNRSYEFEYRRIPFGEPKAYDWRLAKVSYVNSAGTPQEHSNTEHRDRYAIQKVEYSKESGTVIRINYCKPSGKTVLRHNLSSRNGVVAAIADFIASSEEMGAGFIGANTTSMSMGMMDTGQRKSKIKRFVYERDSNGHIIKQTFHSNNDEDLMASNVRDGSGIFGIAYTLDSLGRRVHIQYLDKEGKVHCTQKGIAGKYYEYEQGGNICKATYVGLDSTPMLNEQYWAISIETFNSDGNLIDGSYYSSENTPCYAINGVSQYKDKYDSQGNCVESAYFDVDGNPCYLKEGYSKVTATYDSQGNIVERAYFGVDGNPCYFKEGYSKVTEKYDSQGNGVEWAYFDVDGNPCYHKKGYSKATAKYDSQGNIVERAYFGVDGNPCYLKEGYSKATEKYDSQGNCVGSAYFDVDGNPCYHKEGYSKVTAKYDSQGNLVEFASFDIKGYPCYSILGVAKINRKYDCIGNCIEIAFFDIKGELCYNEDREAKRILKYDPQGNLVEYASFDIKGYPCYSILGVARINRKYDCIGNCIEIAYFDINGNPCYHKKGYSKVAYDYDLLGNCVETAYWGIDGKPCCSDQVHLIKNKYDGLSNPTEFACFDVKGKPCLHTGLGYSKMTYMYNHQGLNIERVCYDEKGERCMKLDELYSKCVYEYDLLGNRTSISLYDIEDSLCMGIYGFSRIEQTYDQKNRIIENVHYDADRNMITKEQHIYNEIGDVVELISYDANGEKRILQTVIQILATMRIAYLKNVPLGSIIIRCNDYFIGDALETFNREVRKHSKDCYYMTPDGNIGNFFLEKGSMGLTTRPISIDKSVVEEYLLKYEEWRIQQSSVSNTDDVTLE